MKKIILSLACLTIAVTAFADKDKPISVSQLPVSSQQFIQTYFPDLKTSFAKMETDLFDKNYEVIFVDGNKVKFDKQGAWKDVDCKYTQVPAGIIPPKIQEYITTNYPNVKTIEIDRDSRDYEVKLSNGIELKFNMKFNLIDMDN